MCRTSRLSSSYGFSLVVEEEEDGGVMPTRYFSRAACALLEGASRTHTNQTPALEMMHENLAKFHQNFASLMTVQGKFVFTDENQNKLFVNLKSVISDNSYLV